MRSILFLSLLISSSSAQADSTAFWNLWSDGKAEVNGYQLTQPRYRQNRKGSAVLIFVTEPFSRSKAVKVDRYNPQDPDQFTALKLNHLQRFRTGVYDYSIMTSVFTDPGLAFTPVKQAFSSQEWCGQVYEEVRWIGTNATVRVDSYFEGESRTQVNVGRATSEDALWIQARGLMSDGPGGQLATNPILGRSLVRRLRHQEIGTFKTTFTWGTSRKMKVPAGAFEVRDLSWGRGDRVSCQLSVEVASPHRIIGWSCTDGERAELTGSLRIPYWSKVSPMDERLLKALGLPGS